MSMRGEAFVDAFLACHGGCLKWCWMPSSILQMIDLKGQGRLVCAGYSSAFGSVTSKLARSDFERVFRECLVREF